MLASASTRDAVASESFPFRRLTEMMVRGRSTPTVVYALDVAASGEPMAVPPSLQVSA